MFKVSESEKKIIIRKFFCAFENKKCLNIYNINEEIIQTSRNVSFPRNWIDKLFSEVKKGPRMLFEAGRGGRVRHILCCPSRSVCLFRLFSQESKESLFRHKKSNVLQSLAALTMKVKMAFKSQEDQCVNVAKITTNYSTRDPENADALFL